jgi:hypothetical protein
VYHVHLAYSRRSIWVFEAFLVCACTTICKDDQGWWRRNAWKNGLAGGLLIWLFNSKLDTCNPDSGYDLVERIPEMLMLVVVFHDFGRRNLPC